jgi:hypothetical protein
VIILVIIVKLVNIQMFVHQDSFCHPPWLRKELINHNLVQAGGGSNY